MKDNNILYIGLSGLAGSGKDTVAKALSVMLAHNFTHYNDFINYYNDNVGYETKMNFRYATYGADSRNNNVMCVAFADRLKQMCSCLFGVPVDRFYYNKANAYICINKDFEYTEYAPSQSEIITAEEYYSRHNELEASKNRYYMSLREVLVYVGTYIMQEQLNRKTFINSVNNSISSALRHNDIKYVICTDVRFDTELDYIKSKHGVTIRVERPGIEQMENIAENALDIYDLEDEFDFVIDNDSDYDALFRKLWDIVHDNVIFENKAHSLYCRDNSNNYLREIASEDSELTFELCTEMPLSAANMSYGTDINMIDPQGGPMIVKNEVMHTADGNDYIVNKIWHNVRGNNPIICINASVVKYE